MKDLMECDIVANDDLKATVVLNKSNSDGFLDYPFDLSCVIRILDDETEQDRYL